MGNAYILVVLGIILAKGVGFYRDIAFSGAFGTSVEADIYFQVFNIVNLIFAGIGVAMGNGAEEVKAVADYVTADIDDDGIEKALKHFNLI